MHGNCGDIRLILRLRIDDFSDFSSTVLYNVYAAGEENREEKARRAGTEPGEYFFPPMFSHSHPNCITVKTFNKLVGPLTQADI